MSDINSCDDSGRGKHGRIQDLFKRQHGEAIDWIWGWRQPCGSNR